MFIWRNPRLLAPGEFLPRCPGQTGRALPGHVRSLSDVFLALSYTSHEEQENRQVQYRFLEGLVQFRQCLLFDRLTFLFLRNCCYPEINLELAVQKRGFGTEQTRFWAGCRQPGTYCLLIPSDKRFYQELSYNASTRRPQEKQGRRRLVHAPVFTDLRLLAAGTRGAAVSRRAATHLRCLRCSCDSKRDNSHQQHYFRHFHNLLPKYGKSYKLANENVRAKNPGGLLASSKCEVRALEEECLAQRANGAKSSRMLSQKRNWTRGSLAAPTPQHRDQPANVARRFVSELKRFPLDSKKSYGARSFLSRPPDCAHGGSTILQRRHHDQGMARR
jgi:hypothetical protein